MIKIYIINLEKDVSKRDRMTSILESAGITNYEFIKAVDGESSINEISSLVDLNKMNRVYRQLTLPEIGCSLSHQLVYKKIIESNNDDRCIILEDDVVIDDRFKQIVDSEYFGKDIDLLFFGLMTSNIENKGDKNYPYTRIGYFPFDEDISRCYFTNNSIKIANVDFYEVDKRMYTIDFLFGGHGYSPSKQCCQKMIELNTPIIFGPDWIWNMYDMFKIYAPTHPIITQDRTIPSRLEDGRKLYDTTKNRSKIFIDRINSIEFNR